MKITVTSYDKNWIYLFNKEKELLKTTLPTDEIENIYHIGSTSVPNLAAKPIIDILIVAKNIKNLDTYKHLFESMGYEVMGEFGIKGRRYYRKGGDLARSHQIHAFDKSDTYNITRHLALRDYLRTHPKRAKAYGALKIKLAKKYPKDIIAYGDGKDEFVKKLEKDALIWQKEHNI